MKRKIFSAKPKLKKRDNTQAFFLDKVISYEKGSIVSKELVKKESGTVTLFSFDKGQGLSEHTAPFDALVYVISGEAKIFISKKPHIVRHGEMIIMPANKPHSLQAKKRFKMLLVLIKK
jgi:quercetin dioxygenase-like cupin family protein